MLWYVRVRTLATNTVQHVIRTHALIECMEQSVNKGWVFCPSLEAKARQDEVEGGGLGVGAAHDSGLGSDRTKNPCDVHGTCVRIVHLLLRTVSRYRACFRSTCMLD